MTNECNCDEMLQKMEYQTRHISLSWKCEVHGAVEADCRHVTHTHQASSNRPFLSKENLRPRGPS